MKQIRDWAYLLFRPKWERLLYKLLRKVSNDENLRLGTVLYDYCHPGHMDGKLFKSGVDAMFIGWLGRFNAKRSASLQAQEMTVGLEPMPDGTAPAIATHEVFLCNRTLKEYLQRMAAYISSENVSNRDRDYLKDLLEYKCLGLFSCWQGRQIAARKMITILAEKGISAEELYADNFADLDSEKVQSTIVCLGQAVGITNSHDATKTRLPNWATVVACYCSRVG